MEAYSNAREPYCEYSVWSASDTYDFLAKAGSDSAADPLLLPHVPRDEVLEARGVTQAKGDADSDDDTGADTARPRVSRAALPRMEPQPGRA